MIAWLITGYLLCALPFAVWFGHALGSVDTIMKQRSLRLDTMTLLVAIWPVTAVWILIESTRGGPPGPEAYA